MPDGTRVVVLGSNEANSSLTGGLSGVGPIINAVTFSGGVLQLFGHTRRRLVFGEREHLRLFQSAG